MYRNSLDDFCFSPTKKDACIYFSQKAVYNSILHSIEGAERREELFDNWLTWIFVDLPFETVVCTLLYFVSPPTVSERA